MLIYSKITSLDSLSKVDTLSIPAKLIDHIALKASIPALGLWVLLCNQVIGTNRSKIDFCKTYQLSQAAFDNTMAKLATLNVAWQEQDLGSEDWVVANLPKALALQTEKFLFQLENMFNMDDLSGDEVAREFEQPIFEFHQHQQTSHSTNTPAVNIAVHSALNKEDETAHIGMYRPPTSTQHRWDSLELALDFFDIAATKVPKELVQQYWDSFISTNDNKGEVVPARALLFKKWKAYIANVSVNLAVSDRRYSNNIERKVKSNNIREQKNIDAWQALLEQRIPQEQSYSAMMSNLATVENDVWLGFVQQNIRFKNDPMNPTTLQYAFEEYCKTNGQKFLRKKDVPSTEIEQQLNDTSWANNLDDVL